MKLIKGITQLKKYIKKTKSAGKRIGLVPTMGYLHQGHLSLIRKAREECGVVVVSIFINPAQFGPKEDYRQYPRNLKRDIRLAQMAGADIIFAPSEKAMYSDGFQTYVNVEKLSRVMCGTSRPTHFKGVATVVAKLFNIVEPDAAYFGQKDAQQAIIIKQMAKDFNMKVNIKTLPIIREKDGLAMSSRNIYLSRTERKNAVILYKALKQAKHLISSGIKDTVKIIKTMKKMINAAKGAKIDYICVVDAENLLPLKTIKGKALIALAVYFGRTRLIDNIMVKG